MNLPDPARIVMSITHSISDRTVPDAGPYTVIGGEVLDRERKDRPGLSIVLLGRGASVFRRDLFEELCKLGAREVLSIESGPCPYDVESLTRRHEKLRFLIFAGESSTGARIDSAIREALSDHVFVLHGDMKINAAGISSRVFSKISERGRLCTVPVFRDNEGELLPTALGPLPGRGGAFDVQPTAAADGEVPTLVPWDYTGIYRKDKHLALGGFDPLIIEPWWQKLDYGMRAWLWGEEIRTHSALRVGYLKEMLPEDSTPGPGYPRFFLKNLAVRRRGDTGRLPRSRWWSYLRSSGDSAVATRELWLEIRAWVNANRFRFVRDATELTELWDWGVID